MGTSSAPVSLSIIGLTIFFSLLGFSSPQVVRGFAIQPWIVIREGRWYQMLTSGFLHAGGGHIFVNMFTLFFFGPPMERLLGGTGFLILYIGSLFCGSLATLILHYRDPAYRALGASGAVSGVVLAFALFRPLARIHLFLIPIGIPAFLFAIGYIVVSIYGARSGRGRIGHAAHLGGALGGVLLTIALHPQVISIFLSHFR